MTVGIHHVILTCVVMTNAKHKGMEMKTLTGGDRVVVLTNGKYYVTQFNSTFGIVQFGTKEEAIRLKCEMSLSSAVDTIKDICRFGVHKLHAELV